MAPPGDQKPVKHGVFPKTRWSLVEALGGEGKRSEIALEQLCADYWYPVYSFLRRKGHDVEDAEDLTQGFFALLLERNLFERASRAKGLLRTFLLNALKNHEVDELRKSLAQKRGSGIPLVSIEAGNAEERYQYEPPDPACNAEELFDRRWAAMLLEQAFRSLASDYQRVGKSALYRELKPFLAGENHSQKSYADSAAILGMSAGAIQVAVHRLRKRYRIALEEVIADTVETSDDIQAELDHVFAILSKRP